MKNALLIATVLGLAACSDDATIGTVAASEPATPIASSAIPLAEPAAPAPQPERPNPDKELAERVAQAIEGAKLQGIDVGAADGSITLWGTVPSERARKRAVQAARKVQGVKSVDDKLAVLVGS